jgi:hypothetical protein
VGKSWIESLVTGAQRHEREREKKKKIRHQLLAGIDEGFCNFFLRLAARIWVRASLNHANAGTAASRRESRANRYGILTFNSISILFF